MGKWSIQTPVGVQDVPSTHVESADMPGGRRGLRRDFRKGE